MTGAKKSYNVALSPLIRGRWDNIKLFTSIDNQKRLTKYWNIIIIFLSNKESLNYS